MPEYTPQQECLYCAHRGRIGDKNLTTCNTPHKDVTGLRNAAFLGMFDYPVSYSFDSKTTACPNFEKRFGDE